RDWGGVDLAGGRGPGRRELPAGGASTSLWARDGGGRARPRGPGGARPPRAIAIAVGPLLGGLATTYASWRLVFAGEVLVVLGILFLARRMDDPPVEVREHLYLLVSVLSAAGLGLVVFGILRSSEWGWVIPKE